jgi:hypothetical protein
MGRTQKKEYFPLASTDVSRKEGRSLRDFYGM